MHPGDKKLVERYLGNELTGIELQEFIDRLESDLELKKEVSFQNLLIEGVHIADDEKLNALIHQHISYRKQTVPSALKFILLFILITAGGIILWNYIEPDSKRPSYLTFNFLHKSKPVIDSTQVQSPDILPRAKREVKLNPQKPDTSFLTSAIPDSSDGLNEEIVVKKDQLLISLDLKPVDLNDEHATSEENLSSTVAEKLNPEGELPSTKNEQKDYHVEFWVSPVNYKGYKLFSDKLILFGIEEPDAVQLFLKGEKLFMKYGNDLYALESSDDFGNFIQSSAIRSSLK